MILFLRAHTDTVNFRSDGGARGKMANPGEHFAKKFNSEKLTVIRLCCINFVNEEKEELV